MKVLTVVGTRPEIIKLSMVLKLLDSKLDHVLVHTGQNFDKELNENFFSDLGLKSPHYYLDASADNPITTISNMLVKVNEVLEKEKPDAFVIYGDTNSCISVLAAKRKKIPIFHMEAGNRCFDLNVPEEVNRKLVDHLSDINFVLTEHARRYLIREGISQDQIILSGSHMPEILEEYKEKISTSKIMKSLNLENNEFILVSSHREEIVDDHNNLKKLVECLDEISDFYKKKIIVSTHPRTKNRLEEIGISISGENKAISFLKPFNFTDYINLQKNAFCVISDSGTIAEESAILNFPAVTIRPTHERPEVYDSGTLIMSEINPDSIKKSIDLARDFIDKESNKNLVEDYQYRETSKIIVNNIFSLTAKINKYTWRK
tara:strand:- start:563 stop:1687 length:1125 start_codon:yes stop_codon:yes gene_type:complete